MHTYICAYVHICLCVRIYVKSYQMKGLPNGTYSLKSFLFVFKLQYLKSYT